jgi:hypothetical protein
MPRELALLSFACLEVAPISGLVGTERCDFCSKMEQQYIRVDFRFKWKKFPCSGK